MRKVGSSSFAIALGIALLGVAPAFANHPVLVEGHCDSPVPGTTIVAPGTCGDFDGDGRVGTAEDTDGADRIFGTISAALGTGTGAAAGTGANQNGTVTIVSSGRFQEQLVITGVNGNVTVAAAPGVAAIIDAVFQGEADDPNPSVARQALPGVVVNAAGGRTITLRNLVIRNWAEGIQVDGGAVVNIDNCKLENNLDYGIHVAGSATATITDTEVNATGFRVGGAADNTPNPGMGIQFQDSASGAIVDTTVTGSASTGIANGSSAKVRVRDVRLFDNSPNSTGVKRLKDK